MKRKKEKREKKKKIQSNVTPYTTREIEIGYRRLARLLAGDRRRRWRLAVGSNRIVCSLEILFDRWWLKNRGRECSPCICLDKFEAGNETVDSRMLRFLQG